MTAHHRPARTAAALAALVIGPLAAACGGADPAVPSAPEPAAAPSAPPLQVGAPLTVALEGIGPKDIAVTPDGTRVLVLAIHGITVLDAGTRTPLGVIDVDSAYGGLQFSPDGERLYVSSPDGIVPVELRGGLVGDPVPGSEHFEEAELLAVGPDEQRFVGVTAGLDRDVLVHDVAAAAVRRAALPQAIDSVVVAPDLGRAYAAGIIPGPNLAGEPVHVVDLATGRTAPVPGTEGAHDVAAGPGGSVYALGSRGLDVLDAATATVTREVPNVGVDGRFVVSPSGRYLCMVDVLINYVRVYDVEAEQIVAQRPIPDQPTDLAIAPDGRTLYVVSGAGLTIIPFEGGAP